jgi:hypothetical protein
VAHDISRNIFTKFDTKIFYCLTKERDKIIDLPACLLNWTRNMMYDIAWLCLERALLTPSQDHKVSWGARHSSALGKETTLIWNFNDQELLSHRSIC